LANTKSAKKAIRVSERRTARNKPIRSATKTFLRRAEAAITASAAGAEANVAKAVSMLDKAATKGVIHDKNAARHKSRLMKKLNRVLAAQA
jgi:small subunit ribosomal protein S20